MSGTVVYIAAYFPKRSETFVYREVLGLMEDGINISVATVRPPQDDMGDDTLNGLKEHLIHVYGSGIGWLATALGELLTHPVTSARTLYLSLSEALTLNDFPGWNSRLKNIIQGVASLTLARRLRPLNPVLLHAHMAHVPTTIARYTSKQLNIPFSFTGHAADLFRDRTLLSSKLSEAAFVNCISNWHRSFYNQEVPRPDQDYPIVRCGVDPGGFPSRTLQKNRPPLVMAVGRLVSKKGFDLLLSALADPTVVSKEWEAVLIGDGPEREALTAQWNVHPAKERIQLKGSKPNHIVRETMSEADIFVLPCRIDQEGDRDGIPVVLMEAMAAGATVISGDIPSIRELIQDGVNGKLVSSEDLPGLILALNEVLSDESIRIHRVQKGHQRINEEFSLSKTIMQMRLNLTSRNLISP